MLDSRGRRLAAVLLLAVLAALVVSGAPGRARPAEDDTSAEPASRESLNFLQLINYSGPIGYLIILLSFVSVALVIEQVRGLRRERLMPPATVAELQDLINGGRLKEALIRCEEEDSFVSSVVGAAISVVGSGGSDPGEINTAMAEAGEAQTARLYRRVEYLSLIGNVAPMLGLLGTVTGMILAFNQVAVKAERVRPPDLAHGISQALVTTCMGLIVAIPTMTAFVLLRSRIDALVAEAEAVVAQLTAPLRRKPRRTTRRSSPSSQARRSTRTRKTAPEQKDGNQAPD